MRKSVFASFLVCGFCFAASADPPKSKQQVYPIERISKLTQIETQSIAKTESTGSRFEDAAKQGLVMNGIRDVAGLQRIVLDAVDGKNGVRNQLEDALGDGLSKQLDRSAIEQLGALIRMDGLAIDRIEFVPGLEGFQGGESGILDPLGDELGYDRGEFGPDMPSQMGLVSAIERHNTPNGYVIIGTYDDLSMWSVIVEGGAGKKQVTYLVTGAGGVETWSESTTYYSDGRVVPNRRETNALPAGRAWEGFGHHYNEEQRRQREARSERPAQDNTAAEKPTSEKPENPAKPADKPAGGGKLDQYQPADGTGTFCPMTVEVCRRQIEQALADGEQVLVGGVYVNPAEPNVQPEASSMVYDPQELVINPSPEAWRGRQKFDPSRYSIRLPVWVNPPGPDEAIEKRP